MTRPYRPSAMITIHAIEPKLREIETQEKVKLPRPKEVSFPLPFAVQAAEDIISAIRNLGFGPHKITVAGSVRREVPSVHDLDILISPPCDELRPFIRSLGHVLADGPKKITILMSVCSAPAEHGVDCSCSSADGDCIQVDFRFIPSESWGPALQYFTGSREHNISLRRRAKQEGLLLNENGLWDSLGKRVDDGTEGGIYKALGLRWLPPRYREGYIGEPGRSSYSLEDRGICAVCHRKHKRPYSTCTCCFSCVYYLEGKYGKTTPSHSRGPCPQVS